MPRSFAAALIISALPGGSGCTTVRTEIEVSHHVKASVPEDAATIRVVLERSPRGSELESRK